MKRVKLFITFVVMIFVVSGVVFGGNIAELRQKAQDVGRNMKKYVGMRVEFVDEALLVYKADDQEGSHVFFETRYIPCRISVANKADLELLQTIIESELPPHLVHISGTILVLNEFDYVCEVDSIKRLSYK